MRGAVQMQITTIGLDIAKNVFQIHGIDAAEKVVVRKQLRRSQVMAFFEALPPCLIGSLRRSALAPDSDEVRHYYNELRTHRSLNKDAPIYRTIQHVGCIVSAP